MSTRTDRDTRAATHDAKPNRTGRTCRVCGGTIMATGFSFIHYPAEAPQGRVTAPGGGHVHVLPAGDQ